MEEKRCVICGAKIENPRKNSKTCCGERCKAELRRRSALESYNRRKDADPEGFLRNHRERIRKMRETDREKIDSLEKTLLEYKTDKLLTLLKDTYFVNGCGGENLDHLLEVVRSAVIDNSKLDSLIESLNDAKTI
jgi:hypothetical protein